MVYSVSILQYILVYFSIFWYILVYFCILLGFVNLARQGSMRIRNSFRRRGSLHRKEEHDSHGQNHLGLNSEEELVVNNSVRIIMLY